MEPAASAPLPIAQHRDAWRALLMASELTGTRRRVDGRCPGGIAIDGRPVTFADGTAVLQWSSSAGWRCADHIPDELRHLIDLYLPVCQPVADGVAAVGHLGQSLDGCIATRTGDSCWVTGRENIVHLHRMRALCDAVVVGAGTVASDDPRLTTRLVPGCNPVRIVLDPRRRLDDGYRIFRDGEAETLLCCADKEIGGNRRSAHGQAEVLGVPERDGRLDLAALAGLLARRGLQRLFVEGGGVTVSDFLAQGVLCRLQIAVAPLIIGGGRRGVTQAARDAMTDALRPPCRIYRMGTDMLYDFDLQADQLPAVSEHGLPVRIC